MAAQADEGTAVEVPRLEEGFAGGAEAALDAVRDVRSFDYVAALRRAACLKGPESLTEEKGKRRLARRWWPSSSRQSCAPVTRQADVDCPAAHSHMERVNSDTCRI